MRPTITRFQSLLGEGAAALEAANTDGDSDSIACIAGGISRAFNGLGAIPAPWQKDIENSAYLRDVARRLWTAAESAAPTY